MFTGILIGSYWCCDSTALNTTSRNANKLPAANGPCCNEIGKILTDSPHTSYCSNFRHNDFALSPFISPRPWQGITNEPVTEKGVRNAVLESFYGNLSLGEKQKFKKGATQVQVYSISIFLFVSFKRELFLFEMKQRKPNYSQGIKSIES